jgi:hypothetical protein
MQAVIIAPDSGRRNLTAPPRRYAIKLIFIALSFANKRMLSPSANLDCRMLSSNPIMLFLQ